MWKFWVKSEYGNTKGRGKNCVSWWILIQIHFFSLFSCATVLSCHLNGDKIIQGEQIFLLKRYYIWILTSLAITTLLFKHWTKHLWTNCELLRQVTNICLLPLVPFHLMFPWFFPLFFVCLLHRLMNEVYLLFNKQKNECKIYSQSLT